MPKERLVTVPFSYEVKHVLKGKRNPKTFTILDEVQVVLPDLTSAEAPTALRFTPEEWRMSKVKADHPWWDGRLWEPFSRVASGEEDRGMTFEQMIAALESTKSDNNDGYYSPFKIAPHKMYGTEYTTLDALPPGRTEEGAGAARAEKVTRIHARAAALILVDGKVYVPCEEPVYMVESPGLSFREFPDQPGLWLKTVSISKVTAHRRPDTYWRADRLDEAMVEIGESENRRRVLRGKTPFTPEELIEHCVLNRIEVLMPQVLRFRYDMRPRVDIAAAEALDTMKRDLAEADVDYFRAYVVLRDLLRAEPRDHEAVVAALRDPVAGLLREAHGHVAGRIDEAVAEWIDRDDPAAVADADLAGLSAV